MAFNLKKVLKALLYSSSQPLSTKDIQAAFERFHRQAAPAAAPEAPPGAAPPPRPRTPPPSRPIPPTSTRTCPSLVTAAQIREAMDEIAAELAAGGRRPAARRRGQRLPPGDPAALRPLDPDPAGGAAAGEAEPVLARDPGRRGLPPAGHPRRDRGGARRLGRRRHRQAPGARADHGRRAGGAARPADPVRHNRPLPRARRHQVARRAAGLRRPLVPPDRRMAQGRAGRATPPTTPTWASRRASSRSARRRRRRRPRPKPPLPDGPRAPSARRSTRSTRSWSSS